MSHAPAETSLENPILNGPYDEPSRHFEIGPDGPTGVIRDGRRASESYVPIPPSRKGQGQAALDFDITRERREQNTLINDIRFEVQKWRSLNYSGATPITRTLLRYWSSRPPEREEPVFYCQREAVETAIFLAEVAGRHGTADYRTRIDPENALHNNGLPRTCLKMATGTGKTVVMAMLIAWQTINKVATPRGPRFAKRFLVVTPGITIKDRLRVLEPSDPNNYYRERDLVPPDLWNALLEAQLVITNYHAFLARSVKEIQGVASNTRKILTAGKSIDPFLETPDQVVARVTRDLSGKGKGELIVFNDEAHHCYRDKPLDADEKVSTEDKGEVKQRNDDARVWFNGLKAVQKKLGIKAIYDLSATPFYLRGSGYNEGYIFPWAVSDFSLMDAIESGIVKVPRIPVDDDAAGDVPTYRSLWDYVGSVLPKRKTTQLKENPTDWVPPKELEGALQSLYRSYKRRFEAWEKELQALGEPPPVMIVVCPNTLVSKLVFDWIAGIEIESEEGAIARPGNLPLFSNVEDGHWTARPRTILVDSAQLERGEVMGRDFKSDAIHEIEAFKSEYRKRNPGADVDALTDEDLLREVMNTVGKKGKLGEQVRCVVSVAMLTEGWDANTVTHILGIRRFGSQLLCEQVVGRGLRRRSYAVNDEGRFDPEYSEVYGVPFAFIPGKPVKEAPPKPPAIEVFALDDRRDLRIEYPKVDGYRLEIPDETFFAAFDDDARLHVSRSTVATWVKQQGVVGEAEEELLDGVREARTQAVAYAVAKNLAERRFTAKDQAARPWLFPQLARMARDWINGCVTVDPDAFVGMLLLSEGTNEAAEKLFTAIVNVDQKGQPRILPILRPFDPVGSTDDVYFTTRKVVIDAEKSHVNRVVLDGQGGNTWEQLLAEYCENHEQVHSFVKNDHLGFGIPYLHKGRSHQYLPDFLLRLKLRDGDQQRTLIVETSGSQKSPGPTHAKAETARFQWCAAVNNHGGFGCWGYIEIEEITTAKQQLNDAIENLYRGGTVTGLRDRED